MLANPDSPNVLVTDFDGTMTKTDFYLMIAARFLKTGDLAPWQDYLQGKTTHFQALRDIFSRLREPESRIVESLGEMELDPRTPECVRRLRQAGWRVVIASAGCQWYVRRVLADCAEETTIFANPGTYRAGGPLDMTCDAESPFFNPGTGVDKAAVVRHCLSLGKKAAYAGDSLTDADAAMLVPAERRFAKKVLAEELTRRGAAFRPFTVWSEIADALLDGI